MRERPILFSAPMVRALLAGTKTQTRRVVKGGDLFDPSDFPVIWGSDDRDGAFLVTFADAPRDEAIARVEVRCPYGVLGDVLWVKETYRLPSRVDAAPPSLCAGMGVWYEADTHRSPWDGLGKLRPSIHMPRWASRISLRITDVRVERLNDISMSDALAEGMTFPEGMEWGYDPKDAYRGLWEHLNGAGSWALNPWVWAVSFERVTP